MQINILKGKNAFILVIIFDLLASLVSTYLAFHIRLDFSFILEDTHYKIFLLSIFVQLAVFLISGLYGNVFRFVSIVSLRSLLFSCFVYGVFFFAILFFMKFSGIPRSIGLLQPLILFLIIIFSRIFIPSLLNTNFESKSYKRILIYGSGEAGAQLANLLSSRKDIKAVGFIDDDMDFVGRKILGLKVHFSKDMGKIVRSNKIESIFVAISDLSQNKRKNIISECSEIGVNVKFLPPIGDFISNKISIEDFKSIDVDDLLDRKIDVENLDLSGEFSNKTILITGAGGSIGRELCAQIILNNPKVLILIDHSEFNLYQVDRKLNEIKNQKKLDVHIYTKIGSIQDKVFIDRVFKKYLPTLIFHAAAYKHVPLLENAVFESVKNNLFGTINLVETALKYNFDRFLMVSTDKAVRPTNIMGATKRLAEIFVQSRSKVSTGVNTFSIVRFGNVLESSGSVIPLFREQLKSGQKLTVTHPDITRYFMTIPEAVRLILEANFLAKGGEIFLLDMGKPVKILELAIKFLEMNGIKCSQKNEIDNYITFTGLRPGEKLYEELLIDNNPIKTNNKNIYMSQENVIPPNETNKMISELNQLIEEGNENKTIKLLEKFSGSKFKSNAFL